MEAALAIIGTILVSLIIWALTHSSRCADFHERLARLEERLGMKQ